MQKSIAQQGPQFTGTTEAELRTWAWQVRLPWVVEYCALTAGAICGTLDETLRAIVAGMDDVVSLPKPIDWAEGGIMISPPGTGKGMAWFVEALAHYDYVYVLMPSVLQAHMLENSLDALYHQHLGGCLTSQRKNAGLIRAITTGIFHMLVSDKTSDLWTENCCIIVDEAQRHLDGDDLEAQLTIGYMASQGLPVFIVSATIDPGTLPKVYGHHGQSLPVYQLTQQMHPVKIEVVKGDKPDQLLTELKCLKEPGSTILVFASARREIMRIKHMLDDETREGRLTCKSVAITGAHMAEEQIAQIKVLQSLPGNPPVVVIATPGTADSSVTIQGLTRVVIIDERFEMEWNEFGVLERRAVPIPINHIEQMIRRVGRVQRTDGGIDEVFVISRWDRKDVLAPKRKFDPIRGASPYAPLEKAFLRTVQFNEPFSTVHDYMVTDFAQSRQDTTVQDLINHGMIEISNDPTDPDGYRLTPKGELVISLPFGYKWSRMIAEAPENMRMWLCLAAAGGELRNLDMFERHGFKVKPHFTSEVLQRIILAQSYIALGDDDKQRYFADESGASFRRLEQVEQFFSIATERLQIDWTPRTLSAPTNAQQIEIQKFLVREGLRVGLYDLFFLGKGQKGWSEARQTADGATRRFVTDRGSKLKFDELSVDDVCTVVATQVWFTARNGAPMANLGDVTIVPPALLEEVISARAENKGWVKMRFDWQEWDGKQRLECRLADGSVALPSWTDNQPQAGVEYWCSKDQRLDRGRGPGVWTYWVHHPVDLDMEDAE